MIAIHGLHSASFIVLWSPVKFFYT